MEYLREKVSGNKKRYIDNNFNLDLSYITPRIIAMAIPGEGIEKIYRNNIIEVKKFLDLKHNNKYFIINLSGNKYDYQLFENKVYEYDWIDHQAPTLITLFLICKKMYDYLLADEKHIVVINCKAGKGRTGTIICCFMLFCGLFIDTNFAFDYYSKKRFNSGEGVTQPSQKRYVYFMNYFLKYKVLLPHRIILQGIYLNQPPMLEDEGVIRPYYEICLDNNDKVIFTNKKNHTDQKKIFFTNDDNLNILITEPEISIPLVGDFTINIHNNNLLKNKLIGRVSFNTAFLNPKVNLVTFEISQIDPDNLINKNHYREGFRIIVSIYIKYNYYSLSTKSAALLMKT